MKKGMILALLGGFFTFFPHCAGAKGTPASYEALLAQVPAPPKDCAEAASRWIPDSKSDKSSLSLKTKLKGMQSQSGADVTAGNQKYEDMAEQMKGMSQQEKIAAAMKMANEMQADHRQTLDQTGQSQYEQMNQDATAGKKLNDAVARASASSKTLDDEYAPQFKKIEDDFFTQFHNCPQGPTDYPLESCSKPLEARYHSDYVRLEDQKLVKKSAILFQLKTDLLPTIQSDEAQIAKLKNASTEDAKQRIGLKKMEAVELVQNYLQMVTDAVEEGYQAEHTVLNY